ncbi:glycosyl transferase [Patiriisocius marinistellae]|uniref:Glycosyl transferase n=1 Tax=Patiriisocius marinistellae TaxID=2494560 RepID=A0A5J4G0S7_9FLAO|nr:glycosyltransferase family 4 protein [Patiriisocius marinistellae]GEQ87202.1 glycosyl transferase [Patiriisocius marinistellae]
MSKHKLIRITTIPNSLKSLLRGQLGYMNQFFEVIGISSQGQPLEDIKKEQGVRVIPVTMTRVISPWQDLKSVWQLYKIFKVERPIIVHTHTPKAGTVGMIAAWLARVPNRLHTVAGLPLLEISGKKRVLLNIVEKLTYRCATKVYSNSFGLKEIILSEKLCGPNKIKVIGKGSSNGIDTEFFSRDKVSEETIKVLKEKYKINPLDTVFIFVGRLVGDKGINELVAAFKQISLKNKNSKLLLVGSLESELDPLKRETLLEMEANDRIILTGYQTDVRPFFSISNALVFPSYREGFPNVVMQAGAMGIPSIVSNINGCNEIIDDGINGWIIEPKNEIELMYSMLNLISFNNEVKDMGTIARNIVVKKFHILTVWESIKSEYNSLIKIK